MIPRGVPLPSIFLYYQWDIGSFVWGGGGGGDILFRPMFLCFVYHCFVFIVLVLVVYSSVNCLHMSCVLFLVLHAVVGSV